MHWSFGGTEPVQIIQPNEANMIILDEKILEEILTKNTVKDKLVSVVSVVGTFRQGKSYLLNFMHRYLKHNYPNKDIEEWLSPSDGPLKNVFSAASGSNRQTDGIRMSRDIFLVKTEKGEVAVFLLDTQGSFDNKSTTDDCAKIFTISSLLSSVQVYNLKRGFRQYDIDHLRLFASYAADVATEKCKTFQDVWFLVRDWQFEYEHPYGVNGGEQYLAEFLKGSIQEVQDNMTAIKAIFSSVKCFLMPHPGYSVATSKDFIDDLNEIGEKFKNEIMAFIPMLLSSENLVLKKVNNETLTAGDFFQYIQGYNEVLRKEEGLPKLDSFSKTSSKIFHMTLKEKAFDLYKKEMKPFFHKKDIELSSLREAHTEHKSKSLKFYKTKCERLADEEIYREYLEILKKDINGEFELNEKILKERNARKEKQKLQYIRIAGNVVQAVATVCTLAVSNPIAAVALIFGGGLFNGFLHRIKPKKD